jgi:DNA (cytosine-5)-methyltransferase 1
MNILSLFSNVGFGEYYLKKNGFNVVVANELLQDRVDFYKTLYPDSQNVICGDIGENDIQSKIINTCKEVGPIDIVLATPPCQGMSLANATKESNDPRNTLVVHAMDVFKAVGAKYMLIENVTNMPNTYIYHPDYGQIKIIDYIEEVIPEGFKCITQVVDGKYFNTPQDRKRSITLISKNGKWKFPKDKNDIVSLKSSIGYLDSIEAESTSDLKWHFSSKHNPNHIDWMKHTPSGKSAYFNKGDHYPTKTIKNESSQTIEDLIKNGDVGWHTNPPVVIDKDGNTYEASINTRSVDGKLKMFAEIPPNHSLKREIYGFTTAYKRMSWDKPAPTVTMTNGSISSQNNVHPGRLNDDGTFSDARVLTIREVLLVCGLPPDLLDSFAHEIVDDTKFKFKSGKFGYDYHPSFIRKVLGELFLPKVSLAIFSELKHINTSSKQIVKQLEFAL